MEIFDDAHTKAIRRVDFLKSLAPKLNGSFVNRFDKLIYKFDISDLYTDLENGLPGCWKVLTSRMSRR